MSSAMRDAFSVSMKQHSPNTNNQAAPSSSPGGSNVEPAPSPSSSSSVSASGGGVTKESEKWKLVAPAVEAVYPTFFILSWQQPQRATQRKPSQDGGGGGGASPTSSVTPLAASSLASSSSQLALHVGAKWRYQVDWKAATEAEITSVETASTHCVIPVQFSGEQYVVRVTAKLGTQMNPDFAAIVGEKVTVGTAELTSMPWLMNGGSTTHLNLGSGGTPQATTINKHQDPSFEDKLAEDASTTEETPQKQQLRTSAHQLEDEEGSVTPISVAGNSTRTMPSPSLLGMATGAECGSPARFTRAARRNTQEFPIICDAFATSTALTSSAHVANRVLAALQHSAADYLDTERPPEILGHGYIRSTHFFGVRAFYKTAPAPLPTKNVTFLVADQASSGGTKLGGIHGQQEEEGLSANLVWQLLSLREEDEKTCVLFTGRGSAGSLGSMAAHRLIASALASSHGAETTDAVNEWKRRADKIYCITFDSPREEYFSNGLILSGTAKYSGRFLHIFPSRTASTGVVTSLGLGGHGTSTFANPHGHNAAVSAPSSSSSKHQSNSSNDPQHASPLRRPTVLRDFAASPTTHTTDTSGGDGSDASSTHHNTACLGLKAVAISMEQKQGARFCMWPSMSEEAVGDDISSTLKLNTSTATTTSSSDGIIDTPAWEEFQLEVYSAAFGISFAEAAERLRPQLTKPPTLSVSDGCYAEISIVGKNLQTTQTYLTAYLPSKKSHSLKLHHVTPTQIVGSINLGQFVTSSKTEVAAFDLLISTTFGMDYHQGLTLHIGEDFRRFVSSTGKWLSRPPKSFLATVLKIEPVCSATQRGILMPFGTTKLLVAIEDLSIMLAQHAAKSSNSSIFARLKSVGSNTVAPGLQEKEKISKTLSTFTTFFADKQRLSWLSGELTKWLDKIHVDIPWLAEGAYETKVRDLAVTLSSQTLASTSINSLPLPLCELLLYAEVIRQFRRNGHKQVSIHDIITNISTFDSFKADFQKVFTFHRTVQATQAKHGGRAIISGVTGQSAALSAQFGSKSGGHSTPAASSGSSGSAGGKTTPVILGRQDLNFGAVDQDAVFDDVVSLWGCCLMHNLRTSFVFMKTIVVVGASSGATTLANTLKHVVHDCSFAVGESGRSDHVVVRETQSTDLAIQLINANARATVVFVVEYADIVSPTPNIFTAASNVVASQPKRKRVLGDTPSPTESPGDATPVSEDSPASPTQKAMQIQHLTPGDSDWAKPRAVFVVNKLDEVMESLPTEHRPKCEVGNTSDEILAKEWIAAGKAAVYGAVGETLASSGHLLPLSAAPRTATLQSLVGDSIEAATLMKDRLETECNAVLQALVEGD